MALVRQKPATIAGQLPSSLPRPLAPGWWRPTPVPPPVLPMERPIRRCTFRRTLLADAPDGSGAATYEAECLYGGREAPERLGSLATAYTTCQACTRTGIFRPDED